MVQLPQSSLLGGCCVFMSALPSLLGGSCGFTSDLAFRLFGASWASSSHLGPICMVAVAVSMEPAVYLTSTCIAHPHFTYILKLLLSTTET